jgi:hypothetical protein
MAPAADRQTKRQNGWALSTGQHWQPLALIEARQRGGHHGVGGKLKHNASGGSCVAVRKQGCRHTWFVGAG